MKTASVNKELTLTIPSRAVMWIVVPNLVCLTPFPSTFIFVGVFSGEIYGLDLGKTVTVFLSTFKNERVFRCLMSVE